MKRTIVLALCGMLLSLGAAAQTFLNGIQVSHAKAEGVVHLITGESLHFDKINIPGASDANVKAKTAQRRDTTIKAKDIRALELWNPKQPDSHWLFCYLPCKFPMAPNVWGVAVAVGDILSTYKVATTYNINDDGDLVYVLRQGGFPNVVFYDAQQDDYLIWELKNKKKRAQFFEKDPDMAAKVLAGELYSSDYQYIVENYNPQ
ncbi:MAG: hypothetical protein IJ609_00575 [Paludibacteraceae bacterium]|nr:hypothetical protein [Paludibacteraceae bacterium]MBR1480412.1 hypothetical protein [Paludibacteraceae bacterium]